MSRKTKKSEHYADQRLAALGLDSADITSKVGIYRMNAYEMLVKTEDIEVQRITAGTFDNKYEIVEGPDMVFHYVNLERRWETYNRDTSKGARAGKQQRFYRVRYANPHLHLDKYGDPIKYASPSGSGIRLWFPEKLIAAYENAVKFDTLYMVEGELKAEMASKYGLNIIGLGGIQALASQKEGFPREFEMIIRRCAVSKVVFITDSDAFDLSEKLAESPNRNASGRPWTFYKAVDNFRQYFRQFGQVGIDLELFFSHPLKNEGLEKGLDDILSGSLKGKEQELAAELKNLLIEKVRTTKTGALLPAKGQVMAVYNLTDVSANVVKRIWGLTTAQEFAEKYSAQLKPLGKFVFYNDTWKFTANGDVELAQPILPEERFWEEHPKMHFVYSGLIEFLANRNIGRYSLKPDEFAFVRLDGRVVQRMLPWQIKDYVLDWVERVGFKDVRELLLRGGKSFLGQEALANLRFMSIQWHQATDGIQHLYFQNEYWQVTREGVIPRSLTELPHCIWNEQIRSHRVDFHQEPMVRFKTNPSGSWGLEFSERGRKFDLLRFLYLTSEYAWREREKWELDHDSGEYQYRADQHLEHMQSLASKLTAIGYMAHRYSNPSERRAVIGMDVQNSEVGSSKGRSGKSLLGVIMENVIPTLFIDGKKKALEEDPFLLEEVEPTTGLIWIDDLRPNFNLEAFFAILTGKVTINRKRESKYKLGPDQPLKMYFCTNHAIGGNDDSHLDRQYLLGFGDYFNAKRKPIDVFGRLFFTDWNQDDWSDFFNFIAACLQMYFEKGVVQAPRERLEKRRLRQEIGEDMLAFCERWFKDKSNLNRKIDRKDLQSAIEAEVKAAKLWPSVLIKRKILAYCRYAGVHMNPNQPDAEGHRFEARHKDAPQIHIGIPYKSNGTEFFIFTEGDWTSESLGELNFN